MNDYLMPALVNRVMQGNHSIFQVVAQGVTAGYFATAQAAAYAALTLQMNKSLSKPPKPKGVLDWMPED